MSMHELDDRPPAEELAADWAETPAYLSTIPAEVEIQETPLPGRLETDARAYLEANPDFVEHVKRRGHDVIAHNRRILTGIRLVATPGAIGGVVILWQHQPHRKRPKR